MQVHESSLKWEEFETSFFYNRLYFKKEKYVTIH